MNESTINAIIGASGAIVAALIGGLFALLAKKKNSTNVSIKQKQKGNNNIQIGNSTISEEGKKDV